ncbi:hypothetical protein [Sinomonas sp. ASV322]|uniref:hypothetical protein n=1 Tax=Sinomonas sp. ASV322 TaxID=3041920 RepID=UPI0027DB2ECD|nr:hypothetical protein [Sinomonas sp. ASV322]MDQ4500762.1 hypothetical protein [Sinomonas sp. ASV322]
MASGGAAPPVTVAVALTALVSLVAAAVARLPLPSWALGVGSGALQQVLHLGFTLLAGANAPLFPSAGHVHNQTVSPPAGTAAAAPEDLHLMVVAHVAAALVTALLVAWALRSAERRKVSAAPVSEIVTPGGGQRAPRVRDFALSPGKTKLRRE